MNVECITSILFSTHIFEYWIIHCLSLINLGRIGVLQTVFLHTLYCVSPLGTDQFELLYINKSEEFCILKLKLWNVGFLIIFLWWVRECVPGEPYIPFFTRSSEFEFQRVFPVEWLNCENSVIKFLNFLSLIYWNNQNYEEP